MNDAISATPSLTLPRLRGRGNDHASASLSRKAGEGWGGSDDTAALSKAMTHENH